MKAVLLIPFWVAFMLLAPTDGPSGQSRHEATQTLKAAKGTYSAKFILRRLALPKGEVEAWWGGNWDRSGLPTVLTKIEILHGKKKVFVPASAWSGVGEVRAISMTITKAGCELKFQGGDAHSSYRGTLVVKGELVQSRTIRHSEFPNEYFETTQYHYVTDDGRE